MPGHSRVRTGLAWELPIHDVDTSLRLLGHEPVRVSAGLGCFHPSSGEASEDVAEAVMSFGSGAVASGRTARGGRGPDRAVLSRMAA